MEETTERSGGIEKKKKQRWRKQRSGAEELRRRRSGDEKNNNNNKIDLPPWSPASIQVELQRALFLPSATRPPHVTAVGSHPQHHALSPSSARRSLPFALPTPLVDAVELTDARPGFCCTANAESVGTVVDDGDAADRWEQVEFVATLWG
ncbi:hypothetical protein L484_021995 [Morus notabilis]|uniref:Uncharacterized protein n=1 Tax=Morus notabilis TaxID=981085 RepID=W9RP38_9ROSA|nr:hypothetical protein L484_021995 [Morus notabilis]